MFFNQKSENCCWEINHILYAVLCLTSCWLHLLVQFDEAPIKTDEGYIFSGAEWRAACAMTPGASQCKEPFQWERRALIPAHNREVGLELSWKIKNLN